eukprot:749230-Hanusia_phi.AAC.2
MQGEAVEVGGMMEKKLVAKKYWSPWMMETDHVAASEHEEGATRRAEEALQEPQAAALARLAAAHGVGQVLVPWFTVKGEENEEALEALVRTFRTYLLLFSLLHPAPRHHLPVLLLLLLLSPPHSFSSLFPPPHPRVSSQKASVCERVWHNPGIPESHLRGKRGRGRRRRRDESCGRRQGRVSGPPSPRGWCWSERELPLTPCLQCSLTSPALPRIFESFARTSEFGSNAAAFDASFSRGSLASAHVAVWLKLHARALPVPQARVVEAPDILGSGSTSPGREPEASSLQLLEVEHSRCGS